jgi:two-component system cell cycle response regulator
VKEVMNMANNIQQYQKYRYQDVKVLYVEDEIFSREKLLRVLSRRFANIHVAIDGIEGFQLYQKYMPDLIIADIKMNQMSGLEMIEKIRETNNLVQIIVTTSQEDNDSFIQSIENNANHFILKPIDLDRFLLAIQKSVYQIHLENELGKQKKLTRAILDLQDNLIFVVKNGEIVEFNHAFTAFTSIEKFPLFTKSKVLSNYFVEDPNYFYPLDKGKWTEELMSSGKSYAKMRWKGKAGETIIFFIKGSPIPDTEQILFVCTDITDLEAESRRNELLATMDPLTNSYNRVKFDELLECEMRRSERYIHPFSLILMDIDYFKNVNDHFGHQEGDQILITLSTIVQQRIRECDIFARWGGEEFIILAPETDSDGAKELAESIRSLIEGFNFQSVGSLTCSFGIAEFSNGKPKTELILEVDQALYQSKHNGRNCVSIYTAGDQHD